MLATAMPLVMGAVPVTRLDVAVDQLRSGRGLLRVCLASEPASFPRCGRNDSGAVARNVPAAQGMIRFEGLPPGPYALAVLHDENSNHRLDTFAGIPREGFGFSRNPAVGFGPPRFAAARFAVAGEPERQQVRMRYIF